MSDIENKIVINKDVLKKNIKNIKNFMDSEDFKRQLELMKNIEVILNYTFKLANIFENNETLESFIEKNHKFNVSENFNKDYEYFENIYNDIVIEKPVFTIENLKDKLPQIY